TVPRRPGGPRRSEPAAGALPAGRSPVERAEPAARALPAGRSPVQRAEPAARALPAGRTPVELLVTAAELLAALPGGSLLPGGSPPDRFRRWCEGVTVVAGDRERFAEHWERHNERALRRAGPLWVALGDSAAQGLGAWHPDGGYVSQACAELRRRTGEPWRVVNWSRSGATTADLLVDQLPRLAELPRPPDLVTCGTGANDLLRYPLPRVRALFRSLLAEVPDTAVILDVPLPHGRWGVGPLAAPYVARLNTTIHAAAAARGLPVAYVSQHFTRPWAGKFGPDDFHPNQDGYRLWSDAVLAAVPPARGVPDSHPATLPAAPPDDGPVSPAVTHHQRLRAVGDAW
ncbi:MAG TPA: SGNH/GDSL hydrolase family protein, partial [Mycobacteriales bacterium]|nr:SGNH/GDSL hydrolase family protein [Mycobacteriales bacterium]